MKRKCYVHFDQRLNYLLKSYQMLTFILGTTYISLSTFVFLLYQFEVFLIPKSLDFGLDFIHFWEQNILSLTISFLSFESEGVALGLYRGLSKSKLDIS